MTSGIVTPLVVEVPYRHIQVESALRRMLQFLRTKSDTMKNNHGINDAVGFSLKVLRTQADEIPSRAAEWCDPITSLTIHILLMC